MLPIADKGLEVALMNFLLQNSSIQPNLQQAHVRADFFGGHQVSLAIQRAPGSAGDLQVSLQSPTVGVMCQLRAAVLSQLKVTQKLLHQWFFLVSHPFQLFSSGI